MSKNKLTKFSELAGFTNTYQNYDVTNPELVNSEGEAVEMKGKWNESHFKNDQPIVLELACGGGEYTVAMAEHLPHRNYIGVDIKGARIWKGAKKSIQRGLDNAAFLRTRIEQLDLFLGKDEVSEIWITFPDPFLRKSKAKRRLTSDRFLNIYRKILKKDGFINLKTDDTTLYEYTLETIEEEKCNLIYHNNDIYAAAREQLNLHNSAALNYHSSDLYADTLYTPELKYKTHYEEMHLNDERKIKFVRFSL